MRKKPKKRGWITNGFRNLILGVLIALGVLLLTDLLSCSRVIRRGHPNTRTENTAHNLKTAISTFFTEYRHYPLGKEKLTTDLDSDSGDELMTVLTGLDAEKKGSLNPRRIAFYTGKAAKKKRGGGYRRGVQLFNDGKSAKLWDTWGNLYRVRLDTNYDNRVTNPADSSQQLPETILIWSAGEDGDFSTWEDNVKSW